MSWLNKIISDTLKNKEGVWSRQSLTFLTSFAVSIILGSILTWASFHLNITINPIAENVFNSFMTLTGVMSGTSIASKLIESKKADKENDE
ncbi:MAG TPA: hypothetical protein VLA48_03260 [Nitrososphaeraceae archaeon]|nr:hypothetical protein [Nitrososphaeraceae archaeon]